MTAADLPAVRQHDRDTFGGDRGAVLEWALGGAPQYACIARSDSGPPQYCFGRSGRLFDQIGPVVASDDEHASALVSAAVHGARSNRVVLDAFDSLGTFGGWLGDRGFEVQRPLFRMCRPAGRPRKETAEEPSVIEFAILGPEFA
jgi:hypothetical protein